MDYYWSSQNYWETNPNGDFPLKKTNKLKTPSMQFEKRDLLKLRWFCSVMKVYVILHLIFMIAVFAARKMILKWASAILPIKPQYFVNHITYSGISIIRTLWFFVEIPDLRTKGCFPWICFGHIFTPNCWNSRFFEPNSVSKEVRKIGIPLHVHVCKVTLAPAFTAFYSLFQISYWCLLYPCKSYVYICGT